MTESLRLATSAGLTALVALRLAGIGLYAGAYAAGVRWLDLGILQGSTSAPALDSASAPGAP